MINLHTSNKIIDICPQLWDIFTIYYKDVNNVIFEKEGNLLKEYHTLLGQFKYHLGKLHDSPINSMRKINNDFIIDLYDNCTSELAYEILSRENIDFHNKDFPRIRFPLQLHFRNIKSLHLKRVSKKGIIKNIIHNDWELQYLYLYDELIDISDDNIDIAFVLWINGRKIARNSYRLLLVSAEKVEVVQNHKESWEQIFNSKFIEEYQSFQNYLFFI